MTKTNFSPFSWLIFINSPDPPMNNRIQALRVGVRFTFETDGKQIRTP
jgi:hypothetical protein